MSIHDEDISRTLSSIIDYIGADKKYKEYAELKSYIERLLSLSGRNEHLYIANIEAENAALDRGGDRGTSRRKEGHTDGRDYSLYWAAGSNGHIQGPEGKDWRGTVKCPNCAIEHGPLFPHVCVSASVNETEIHVYSPESFTPEQRWEIRQEIYRHIRFFLDNVGTIMG